jgi:hypothetical protein
MGRKWKSSRRKKELYPRHVIFYIDMELKLTLGRHFGPAMGLLTIQPTSFVSASQDNIAAFLVERVAKYLACLLGIGSQLCHIAEGSNFYLNATSSPFNQISDINVCPSYSL